MRLEHIDPRTTAILVIDMQADFLEPTSGVCVESGYQFLPKMPAFLDACRDKGATIIYSKNVIRPDQRDRPVNSVSPSRPEPCASTVRPAQRLALLLPQSQAISC